MATLKYIEGGTLLATATAAASKSAPSVYVAEVTVDLTRKYSDAAAGTYRLLTSATDTTLEVFAVPVGMKVLDVVMTVVVAGTASSTLAVGDGTTPAGFIVASATDAAAGTQYTSATAVYSPAAASGKLYAAADTIDLLLAGANPGNLVVRLNIMLMRTNASSGAANINMTY